MSWSLYSKMSKKKNNYTPLSSVGEFGLIKRIKSNFDLKNSSSILGIGDDAAIIDNKNKTVKLVRIPKFSEVPYPIVMEPNLVIEYYSR